MRTWAQSTVKTIMTHIVHLAPAAAVAPHHVVAVATWLIHMVVTTTWSGRASVGPVSLLATSPGRPAQSELVELAAEGLAELGFLPCRARISSFAIRFCLLRACIRSRQASRADQCHDRSGAVRLISVSFLWCVSECT